LESILDQSLVSYFSVHSQFCTIAGVIGLKRFGRFLSYMLTLYNLVLAFDLWGDTVNTASRYVVSSLHFLTSSRMESTSLPGRVQVSRSTYERVYDLGKFTNFSNSILLQAINGKKRKLM